jgi:HEAT repeat protein
MYLACKQRIAALMPLLKDSVPEVQAVAAAAIERLENSAGLEAILVTLKNGDIGTRVRAIYALGEIGGEQVLKPLIYCAARPEEELRSAAVAALGKVTQQPEAVKTLLAALQDQSEAVQAQALAALANAHPAEVPANHLFPFLELSDGLREAEAARTIGRLGITSLAQWLLPLLDSPHISTRLAAAEALGRIPF